MQKPPLLFLTISCYTNEDDVTISDKCLIKEHLI